MITRANLWTFESLAYKPVSNYRFEAYSEAQVLVILSLSVDEWRVLSKVEIYEALH